MPWTKKEIEEQRGTIQHTGEFRVHIKYGRGNENGNVCTARLWHYDGKIVGRATGGGYDMRGSVLGDAIETFFRPELAAIEHTHGLGLRFEILSNQVQHTFVDGAVGLETMLSLLRALGFDARAYETSKVSTMILATKEKA